MKKIVLASLLFAAAIAQAATPPEVNEKILNAFRQTFAYAEDVVWQEKDNSYQVNFWQGEINIRAWYDDQGKLLATIRYCHACHGLVTKIVAKLNRTSADAHRVSGHGRHGRRYHLDQPQLRPRAPRRTSSPQTQAPRMERAAIHAMPSRPRA